MEQYVIPLLIHLFPAYATFLTYAGLYAFISGGTFAIRKLYKQWAIYRKYTNTDLPNRTLVCITVLLGIIGPAVALTINGQISDPNTVAHYAKLALTVILASNGVYTIFHHSFPSPLDTVSMLLGKGN